VIQVGLAAPRRAAGLTGLVLGAALLRALLLPFGDLVSTLVFGVCLLAISWFDRGRSAPEARWGRGLALLAGLMVGAVLLVPLTAGSLSARGLDGFWTWAALAAVIAILEEAAIRGALYRRWTDEAGPVAAILAGAVVFALIHLPRYGLGAMPLDAAVGLALGGLRALTGRVLPCAVAHTIADWGAWFWA
jgi:membrane protease YdiL (CAAX protease family)